MAKKEDIKCCGERPYVIKEIIYGAQNGDTPPETFYRVDNNGNIRISNTGDNRIYEE